MTGADALLSQLEGVKRTGEGRWLARCAGHADKSPSLSIRELADGRILVHCFAGCTVEEILSAVGLTFDALFPERPITGDGAPRERRPFIPSEVFEVVRLEVGVVAVVACDMHAQRTVSDEDMARLFVAVERLSGIARAAYGR
jgi:hypothetical protein